VSIVDVPGILVGSVEDAEAATGCTVVVCSEPAVCGVDVRGGAPGTRETDLLAPTALVERVDAIVLAGGSAFGLDAVSGVVRFLEERGRGYAVRDWRVPIVPAAILFDLLIGDGARRPDQAMGYAAAANASGSPVRAGNYGAGCGATVGKLAGQARAMKGGLGSASCTFPGGLVVGVLVAVNALGEIRDATTGAVLAGPRDPSGKLIDSRELLANLGGPLVPEANTTLAVVACNAALTKTDATVVARMAHDGFARAISPAHTTRDGDIVFALATGGVEAGADLVGALAADLIAVAIAQAIRAARTIGSATAHVDLGG
jgi:L-aminopeptidase/D-esterase-like protein